MRGKGLRRTLQGMSLSTPSRRSQPVLLVHGGAWAIPDDAVAAHEHGVRHALRAGWAILDRGGAALEAIETAISVMEDDDTFDAGRGSFLTRDGRVQLDALLMSGADLRAGGVACVEHLRHPIQAARLVLEHSPHVYFVGPGAEAFAAAQGMPLIDNAELVLQRERARLATFQQAEAAGLPDTTFAGAPSDVQFSRAPGAPVQGASQLAAGVETAGSARSAGEPAKQARRQDPGQHSSQTPAQAPMQDQTPTQIAVDDAIQHGLPTELQFDDPTLHSHDTVGAVALDASGNLAAGTSTGGTLSKAPGRVGDSSLIGCGCYADNTAAAVSLTGWGEPMMKLVLGKWATDRVAAGSSPKEAAADAIAYLFRRLGGHGGMILLGPDGRFGLAHNTPRMAWGRRGADGEWIGITQP